MAAASDEVFPGWSAENTENHVARHTGEVGRFATTTSIQLLGRSAETRSRPPRRIAGLVRTTGVVQVEAVTLVVNGPALLTLEALQHTGSRLVQSGLRAG